MQNLKFKTMKQIKLSHLLLIRKIAWSFHKTTEVDWDELFAQASMLYWLSLSAYDAKRKGGKKTTFIYQFIQNELINFLKKEKRHYMINIPFDELTMDVSFFQTPFFELFDALSPDSQLIAEMILSDPVSYAKLPGKMARGLVVKNLKKEKDWTYTKCWDSLNNIKLELMKL